MPTNSAIKKQNLFITEDFLENNFCQNLCNEVKSSIQLQSPLPEYEAGIMAQASTKTRPKIVTEIISDAKEQIRKKLHLLMPEIATHFQLNLQELRDINFAIYRKGTFVARHVDAVENEKSINIKHFRKVTVVIFLNDESEEPTENCYGGGKLTIYGVFENEFFKEFGYPISGLTGKLVAFPSKAFHEVTPVEHGTRLIVSTGFS